MNAKTSPDIDLLSNPIFKEFIDSFNRVRQETENLSLDETRKRSTAFFLPTNTVYTSVERIDDIEIKGKDQNKIPLRIFIPSNSKNLPVLLYFHRGGWVFGNIKEAEPVCRKLAHYTNSIVVAVDYRLAPENPFPKPLEDCYAATEWVQGNITKFGGDPNKLILCGESVGGNMAAAITLMSRDKHGPIIAAQLLICPVISSSTPEKNYEDSPDQYFITKEAMEFFWNMYLQESGEGKNPYASPDYAKDFKGLPPALIITAEYDALKHEAEEYAKKLHHAGVPVISQCVSGVIHGFIDLPIYEESEKCAWITEIGHSLNTLLNIM